MNRNLKALGTALLAAFALSAIAAQGAIAAEDNHEFTSNAANETTVLTGTQTTQHVFTVTGIETKCEVAEFSGTVAGNTEDTVEVHPVYEECTFGPVGVTIHTGGCTYTFDSDTTENTHVGSVKDAPVTITEDCEITLTASGCVIHVTPGQTRHGVTYENIANHGPGEKNAVKVSATVSTIEVTSTGGFSCLVAGLGFGVEHHTDGTYTGDTVMTGFEDDGTTHEEMTNHEYKHDAQVDVDVEFETAE